MQDQCLLNPTVTPVLNGLTKNGGEGGERVLFLVSRQYLQTRDQHWALIMKRQFSYPVVILNKAGYIHQINHKIQQRVRMGEHKLEKYY